MSDRRNVSAFVRIKDKWVRVGSADQSRTNPLDVKLVIDADLETSHAAIEALMQGRLAPIGFGKEPPEPHDDEYQPKEQIQIFSSPGEIWVESGEYPDLTGCEISVDGNLEKHTHLPQQNRDGKEPWCRACGRNKFGQKPASAFRDKD